jgi:hypothetical protein
MHAHEFFLDIKKEQKGAWRLSHYVKNELRECPPPL